MTTNAILAKSISGKCLTRIPADQAKVLVVAPARKVFHTYDNKAFVGETIIDDNLRNNPDINKNDMGLNQMQP
jgi:hypothetical protein